MNTPAIPPTPAPRPSGTGQTSAANAAVGSRTGDAPADPCAADCPVGRCAHLLDGRWTTRIVRDLLPGKRRFSELLHGLAGISPKVLSARLRFLEEAGVLTRTVFAEVPPHTEYALTDLGRRLEPVIAAMASFGRELGETR